MKANQAFKADDEAVSPVIGVILMVAITVVLAAVVFVLVTKLSGNQQNSGESASVSITSPTATKIYITLVSGGQNSPYCVTTTSPCSAADISVTVDSVACTFDKVAGGTAGKASLQDTGATAEKWNPGETIIVTPGAAGSCLLTTTGTSGSTHLVSVTVHGTLLNDNTKVVLS